MNGNYDVIGGYDSFGYDSYIDSQTLNINGNYDRVISNISTGGKVIIDGVGETISGLVGQLYYIAGYVEINANPGQEASVEFGSAVDEPILITASDNSGWVGLTLDKPSQVIGDLIVFARTLLTLGGGQPIAGALDLAAGAVLDLTNVSVASFSFSGGVLTIQETNGAEIAFNVHFAPGAAPYSPDPGSFSESAYEGSPPSGYELAVTPDGAGGSLVSFQPVSGQTYVLTPKTDTLDATGVGNTILAASGTLNPADQIDAGFALNTLALQGGGTFNLNLPQTLSGITTVTAQEGQQRYGSGASAIPSTYQTGYLRNGLSVTLDVEPDPAVNSQNPNVPGITIYGANDSSVINLGNGADIVYLGSSTETVNGGSGDDVFYVDAATDGAAVDGGAGFNILNFTGGGTVAMGPQITGISWVVLDNPAAGQTQPGYVFAAPDVSGLRIFSSNGDDVITVGDASQSVRTGAGVSTVIADAATAGAAVVGGAGGQTTYELEGGGDFVLNNATRNVTVDLVDAGTLALGYHGIAVEGSTGGDVITAGNGRLVAGDSFDLQGSNT
jgi:hypothetical protein